MYLRKLLRDFFNDRVRRRNLQEWIGLTLWLSAAFLLAFGVIRVPKGVRWLIRNYVVSEQENRITKPVVLVLRIEGARNQSPLTLVGDAFLEEVRKAPFDPAVDVKIDSVSLFKPNIDKVFKRKLEKYKPALVLALAEAEGTEYKMEVQAFRPKEAKEGPQRYLSRLPIHEMQKRLGDSDFDASVVYTGDELHAGEPVNVLFYTLMDVTTKNAAKVPCGLVKLPVSSQVREKRWNQRAAQGLRIIVESALTVVPYR